MKLYGIPNCNTVKKARDWLAEHGQATTFHDLKKLGLDAGAAENWLAQRDWSELVNRRGTTWRGLPDDRKLQITDDDAALALMLEKPSVIKRPVLEIDGRVLAIGFDATLYADIFKQEN